MPNKPRSAIHTQDKPGQDLVSPGSSGRLQSVAKASHYREWIAWLNLVVDRHRGQSRLATNANKGPLRLLRPYYPEGQDCAHLYLLHPPGGLVCGDHLQVSLTLNDHANALVTIPSAGKIYRSDTLNHPQIQSTHLHCGHHTQLEWLPQETIVFSGSNGQQNLTIETTAESKFIIWEVTALGRPASGAPFLKGSFSQKMQINLSQVPVFAERIKLRAGSEIFGAAWGLNHFSVCGSMLAGYFEPSECQQILTALRKDACVLDHAAASNLSWSATTKDNVLIIRALAHQSEPVKSLFHRIWNFSRPRLLGKAPHYPRIWST